MSVEFLESLARGACRLAAPVATEAYEDLEEMNEHSRTLQAGLDPDNTWDAVEGVGTVMDRALRPVRTMRQLWGSLRNRR